MKELRDALVENSANASLIKLTVDNRSVFCGKGEIPAYSDEHWATVMNYAEKKNLPVACHCHLKWGFDRATKYPIHSLEHIVTDAALSDSEIDMLVKKKISVIPTMTVGQSYMMEEAYDSIPAEYRDDFIMNELKIRKEYLRAVPGDHIDPVLHEGNMDIMKYYKLLPCEKLYANKKFLIKPGLYFSMMKLGAENLKRMKDAGVNIGAGIDAGIPLLYFGGLYRELELLSRMGFTNAEVLRCATVNNARILLMDDKIGTIEKGKFADIVLLGSNPLEDITAFRKPEAVLLDGRIRFSAGKVSIR
jgi:imidazolonepropionase-like amidohydrolase